MLDGHAQKVSTPIKDYIFVFANLFCFHYLVVRELNQRSFRIREILDPHCTFLPVACEASREQTDSSGGFPAIA